VGVSQVKQVKMLTKTQVSSGGVAYRRAGGQTEVALISVGPENRWQLPKGLVGRGEEPEATALREVREEAGIETELVAPLDRIEYWYVSKEAGAPVRFHKFVYFYLLRYTSGDPDDHDHEVNEARWVEIQEATALLTFESEKKVVAQAAELLQNAQGPVPGNAG
jgi:8-oxo-dGTP pyrophosphatase MutT (NUDIX family)